MRLFIAFLLAGVLVLAAGLGFARILERSAVHGGQELGGTPRDQIPDDRLLNDCEGLVSLFSQTIWTFELINPADDKAIGCSATLIMSVSYALPESPCEGKLTPRYGRQSLVQEGCVLPTSEVQRTLLSCSEEAGVPSDRLDYQATRDLAKEGRYRDQGIIC